MKKYSLFFLLVIVFSFKHKDPSDCNEVQSLYKKANFPIGVAVNMNKLKNDERYQKIILSQFNSITAELIMKPVFIHPEKEIFYFDETDRLMEFCKKNNKRLHGHTLVWHKRLPAWMENFQGDHIAWEAMLKEHIQTIINHCKGTIHSWDVVNEAFNEDGSLRDNIWLKNIGESYIEKSFLYAREADPSAILFYNDYNLESNKKKLNAVLQLVEKLQLKNSKIDGIGLQMHISDNYPDTDLIREAMTKIESQGLVVHYSEVTISLNKRFGTTEVSNTMLDYQKMRMKEIIKTYLTLQKNSQFGITIWGVADPDVNLNKENAHWPLLYNKDYQPKPAYCGLLEALTE